MRLNKEGGVNEMDHWMLGVKKDDVHFKICGLYTKSHHNDLASVHRYTLAHSEKILERSFAQKKDSYLL